MKLPVKSLAVTKKRALAGARLVRLLLLASICRHFASSSSAFISRRHPDGSHYRVPPSGFSAHSSSPHSSWLAGWLAAGALRERHSISTPAKPAVPHLSDWFSGSLALEQIQSPLPCQLHSERSAHTMLFPQQSKNLVYIYINIERDYLYIKMDGVIVTSPICLQILVQMPGD